MEGEPEPQQTVDGEVQEGGESDYILETISLNVVVPNGHKISLQVALTDTVQDVRQYLLETVETGYMTSYRLELEGSPVSDFLELSELVPLGLKDESIFRIIEDSYDERSARLHLRRLREILNFEPATRKSESPSVFSAITNGVLIPSGGVPDDTQPVKLQNFVANVAPNPKGVKQLNYSGWNPPRGNRKLQGDLFYLDVVTLEGESVVVTAWTNGFFVNNTKGNVFDPSPAAKPLRAHALVDLLRELSPKFKEVFSSVVNQHFESHPYELLPVPFPIAPWLKHTESPEYDAARSEEVLLNSCEVDFFVQGQQRDWNEDLQLCRDLPHATPMERINRERNMFRVHSEFVEAAVKGAVAVIDGCVPPINATDEKKAHMYIYNNIFYSYSVDSRDIYKDFGGDDAAYKSASNDLIGLRLYNKVDVDGLYTLATAVVNYRGYRIIAQSIIAGLFSSLMQQDDSAAGGASPSIQIVYGSLEGEEINTDPEFHELVLKAAKDMYIKPHQVVDKKGKEVTLAAHANIKGIKGADGRRYVLDLVRPTPRDFNYKESANLTAILRPELLDAYVKGERDKFLMKYFEEKKAEILKKREEEKDKPEAERTNEDLMADEKTREELSAKLETITIKVNPDLLTQYDVGGSEEDKKEDTALLESLAAYLKNDVIPSFVEDFVGLRLRVTEGVTLTKLLHSHGINLRYLGLITSLLEEKKAPAFVVLAFQREMIVRVTKHIFNDYLKAVPDYSLANTISLLLNSFFGRLTKGNKGFQSGFPTAAANINTNTNNKNKKQKQEEKKDEGKEGEVKATPAQVLPQVVSATPSVDVSHHILWKQIRDRLSAKYTYNLPNLIPGELFSLPTLRGICQKVGIQLLARKYTLTENSFTPADILGVFPIVKHSSPESHDGIHLFELGKGYMAEGRLDKAYDHLNAAIEFFTQVYGPMHQDVGECYANLAKVLLSAGDYQQALVYQQKATIMAERVLGLDTYDTTHFYSTLALLSHKVGKTDLAVKYTKRSLYLNRMSSGAGNTEEISFSSSLGTWLQEQGKGDESQLYLKRSLELCESIYGANSGQAASANHALALSLSFSGNAKEALPYEIRNHEILKSIWGEQDLRTMQAKILVGQLTQAAVQNAKDQRGPSSAANKAFANTLSNLADPTDLQQVRAALSDLPVSDVLKWISSDSPSAVDVQSIASPAGGLAGNKLRPNRAWGTGTQPQASQQNKQTQQTQPQQSKQTKQTQQVQPPKQQAKKEDKPAAQTATQTQQKDGQSKRGRGRGRGRK